MGPLEIIAIIVFPISLSSFMLDVEQSRTPLSNRIGAFRSEEFGCLVFFSSLPFMIASGIVLGMYSWVLLIALFVGAVFIFPLFGRYLVIKLLVLPLALLDKWPEPSPRETIIFLDGTDEYMGTVPGSGWRVGDSIVPPVNDQRWPEGDYEVVHTRKSGKSVDHVWVRRTEKSGRS